MLTNRATIAALAACVLTVSARAVSQTSASYAQSDRLIAHWDGIDNAGKGVHDPEAAVWKDLRGDLDLTLTDKGSWNALGNALYVSGMGAQGLRATPAYQTIEIVYRMTTSGGRLMFVSGIQSRIVCLDAVSGSQNKKLYFDGADTTKRITWPLDTNGVYTAAATYTDNAVANVFCNGVSSAGDTGKNTWGLGGGKVALGGRMATESSAIWTGEIYAIRLYDTVLTEAELAANRAVDAARFVVPDRLRYVQDGLVAHWDGIDNAGTGVHDPEATVWKDLKGGLDLALTNDASWNVRGNALVVSGISAIGDAAAPDYKTIEVVYRPTRSDGRILFNSGSRFGFVLFDNSSANHSVYFSSSGDRPDGAIRDTLIYSKPRNTNELYLVAARYDDAGAVADISSDGGPVACGVRTNAWTAGATVTIGGRALASVYPWYGEVYAIRLYSRRLSRAELAQNGALDRRRFFSFSCYEARDALLAQWDGENNYARCIAHNPTSKIWKDLVGAKDLVLTNKAAWTAAGNGLVVDGASASCASAAPAYRTFEVAYRETSSAGRFLFNSGNTGCQIALFNSDGTKAWFSGLVGDHLYVPWTFDATAVRTMAATYTNAAATAASVYGDGVRKSSGTAKDSWGSCESKIIVGDNKITTAYRPWYGEVYGIRLYDRELTSSEIAFNSALDRKRVALSSRTVTWGGGDGDYLAAANWIGQVTPRYVDTTVVTSGTVRIANDQLVRSVSLGAQAALVLTVPASGAAVPLTVTGTLSADPGAGLVLDASAFGKAHPTESTTLIECGKDSAEALAALATNVSFEKNTALLRRGTVAVEDGVRLVYTAPPKPGVVILFR